MKSGIYEIIHVASGRRYIGSSRDIPARFKAHRTGLRGGRHHNPKLQGAWNKYGEAAFEFRTIIWCAEKLLLFYEGRCIAALGDYNLQRDPQRGGRIPGRENKATAAVRQAMWGIARNLRPRVDVWIARLEPELRAHYAARLAQFDWAAIAPPTVGESRA